MAQKKKTSQPASQPLNAGPTNDDNDAEMRQPQASRQASAGTDGNMRARYHEGKAMKPTSSPEKSDAGPRVRKEMARRATLTKNACGDCRRSKCKCDGKRPVCGRCARRDTECSYDVEEDGTTKMQQLAQQLKSVDEGHSLLLELFDVLQQAPDDMAAALLARIRFGEQVADIVRFLRPTAPDQQQQQYERREQHQQEYERREQQQLREQPASFHGLLLEQDRSRDGRPLEEQEERGGKGEREMRDWFPSSPLDKPWNSWSRRCEDSEAAQPDRDGPGVEQFSARRYSYPV